MITISDTAAEKIKEIMKAEGMPQAGLRIYAAGGCGCGPQLEIAIDDKAGDGDMVVENAGAKLFVDSDTVRKIEGAELGFVTTEQGTGFVISFPNGAPPSGGCDCGPESSSGGGCGSGSGGGCACG